MSLELSQLWEVGTAVPSIHTCQLLTAAGGTPNWTGGTVCHPYVQVVALVVQSAEGLRRRCLPWLRWVAAWQRAGRAPPVQLILEYNIPWVLDEAVQQDLMAPLCFALGACHRSLACLSLHLPIQLYNGCAFLASLTNLVQLRLECGDVEATGVFDAISHLTALTCLKVLALVPCPPENALL